MSKPVSSTALAALAGKKKFGWDDPVRTYLPDLAFSDAYVTDQVTFADLYSHRSGFPGDTGNRLEEIGFTRAQILQRLRYVPLNPFRATYSYSNFGMTAAGEAAAAADETTFENMMQQRLFGSTGMTSTSARYSDFVARLDRAALHIRVDGKWQLGPERDPDAQAPAGGVSSSLPARSGAGPAAGRCHPGQTRRRVRGCVFQPLLRDIRRPRRYAGPLAITQGPERLVFPMTHWSANTFTYVESPETPDFRAALTFTLGSDGTAATLDVGGLPGVNILRRTG